MGTEGDGTTTTTEGNAEAVNFCSTDSRGSSPSSLLRHEWAVEEKCSGGGEGMRATKRRRREGEGSQ